MANRHHIQDVTPALATPGDLGANATCHVAVGVLTIDVRQSRHVTHGPQTIPSWPRTARKAR